MQLFTNSIYIVMKKLIVMLVCLSGLSSVKAQTEKEAVIATIKNFFTGMKTADTVLLKSGLSITAILQTISSDGSDVHVKR